MEPEVVMDAAEVDAIFTRVKSWPFEMQVKLAEVAEMIEATHAEPDDIDDETLAAIEEARAELARGEVVSQERVEALLAQYRR